MPHIINGYYASAAAIAVIVGFVHSALGEFLIFSGLRQGGIVPTGSESGLRERQVRILWATWHLPTIFAFLIGAVLMEFSLSSLQLESDRFVVRAIIASAGLSSFIVLFATKGRHPGWVGLLTIAVVAWLGLA